MKEIEIEINLSYIVSSEKDFTYKEAEKFIKNHIKHGVRYSEFNKTKKVE